MLLPEPGTLDSLGFGTRGTCKLILKRTMCCRKGAYLILYSERLLFIVRLSKINSRTLLVAKMREHVAYDYDFQKILMNFRNAYDFQEISGNIRKCQRISGTACNSLTSPKLGFSSKVKKPHILCSRFKVLVFSSNSNCSLFLFWLK